MLDYSGGLLAWQARERASPRIEAEFSLVLKSSTLSRSVLYLHNFHNALAGFTLEAYHEGQVGGDGRHGGGRGRGADKTIARNGGLDAEEEGW